MKKSIFVFLLFSNDLYRYSLFIFYKSCTIDLEQKCQLDDDAFPS